MIPCDPNLIPQIIRLLELALEAKRENQPGVAETAAHAARMLAFPPVLVKSGASE